MAQQQLSNGNPDGWALGQSASDKGALFGLAGVVMPSGNAQKQPVQGAAAGVVTTWSSFQTAFASAGVATITSAEAGLTIQQGTTTSARVLLATTDFLYCVNKPTSQAGLGIGNVRISAANIVGITISNPTAATLTPTVNQTYTIVSTRGLPIITATWSPAAVPAKSIVEQVLAIVPTAAAPQGIPVGSLVQVSKPTNQVGLDIVGVRAAGNNQVGVTFANLTAATITPTAAESYTFQALTPLDAHNNFLTLTLNGGAVGAIAVGGIISGGTTAFAGVLATDLPIGPPLAPTAANNGAAATNSSSPAYSILSANTMTMWFNGIGTGSTPTANVYFDQLIFRLNPTAPLVIYNTALTPVSVAANTTAEQTFTVTGLVASSAVWVNKPTATNGLGIAGVRVSAADTLAINYINTTASAIVPPAETYVIGNFQQVGPGATTSNASGGAVSQPAVNALASNAAYLTKLRSDLQALGIQAGG